MALLQWDNGGNLYNQVFQDCYFSKEDGLKESRYVFLEGNNLQRLGKVKSSFVLVNAVLEQGLIF
jgi:tRNA U34 5-methylaminomethyl-2-thiouridine-forming methyltransferase MnmC